MVWFAVNLLCFSVIFSVAITTRLKLFTHTHVQIKDEYSRNISYIFPLFKTFSSLCLISDNVSHLTNVIIHFASWNKSVIHVDFLNLNLKKCDCVVFLKRNISKVCSELHYFINNKYIYFLGNTIWDNIAVVSNCLKYSWAIEVLFISIKDFSVFQLINVSESSKFLRTNVSTILSQRTKLGKFNLGGKNITAATMNDPPLTIIRNANEPDGVEILIFRELSHHLNFTLKYVNCKTWGNIKDNGTWVGGMGQAVQQGNADLVLANVWQIPLVIPILDFGPSIGRNKVSFLVRRPVKISFRWKVLLTIFKVDVWMSILLAFVLVTVIYWKQSCRSQQPQSETLIGSLVTVWGHITMSSWHYHMNIVSRYLMVFWSMFCFQLAVYLSSDISSRLTLPQYSPRLDSLQQLVEGGYYWTVQYYARFNTTEYKKSFFDLESHWDYQFEKQYKYLNEDEVRVRASTDEKITFLVQTYGDDFVIINTLGLIGHSALRNFRLSEAVISRKYFTFGVKKNSPLLEPFSILTLRFHEVGLPQQWRSQVIRRWPLYDTQHLTVEHDTSAFSQPEPFLLENLQFIFKLFIVGLCAAFIVFLTELAWDYIFYNCRTI